jgi:hypothetical protein
MIGMKKAWLEVWFEIGYKFTEKPSKKQIDEKVDEALKIFKNTFLQLQPKKSYSFKLEVKTEKDFDFIFKIKPKEVYSLKDFSLDGYVIFKTDEIIRNNFKIRKLPFAVCKVSFDKKENPINESSEGFIRMRYPMRERIEEAFNDIELDKKCFVESVFELVERLKTENKNNPTEVDRKLKSEWLEKVEEIIKNRE